MEKLDFSSPNQSNFHPISHHIISIITWSRASRTFSAPIQIREHEWVGYVRLKARTLTITPAPNPMPVFTIAFAIQTSVSRDYFFSKKKKKSGTRADVSTWLCAEKGRGDHFRFWVSRTKWRGWWKHTFSDKIFSLLESLWDEAIL